VSALVYTIGTSTRTIEEFVSLCQGFELEAVADVRRFPFSKFEYFRKDNFSRHLESYKIRYFYLGDLLGGFREKGYPEYTRSSQFEKGINSLKLIASEYKTAFVCAERFPLRCHRRFIAKRLTDDGWQVIHIIDEERTWEAKDKAPDLKLDI
jgi:uncharacterized protein (DUF488 family)